MKRRLRRPNRRLSIQTLDDRRVLASIAGEVFQDVNVSLRRDVDEAGLSGRVVSIDSNDNAEIDAGEPFALTGESGNFEFADLIDGDYAIRLFNGSSSQEQTTPIQAQHLNTPLQQTNIAASVSRVVIDAGELTERVAPAVVAVGSKLHLIAADGTLGMEIDLGANVPDLSRGTGGEIFALSDTNAGHRAWTVDANLNVVTPFTDSDLAPPLLDFGVDDVGNGIVLAATEAQAPNLEIWSFTGAAGTATATGNFVPANTEVFGDSTPRSNDGPTRSIVSRPSVGGGSSSLVIDVWSNASGNFINNNPITVAGASEVVAFSDEADLLVLRQDDDLAVFDLENLLAGGQVSSLYTLSDVNGPAAIDPVRGLLMTLKPAGVGVHLHDAETGSLVKDLAIDLAPIGQVSSIALDDELKAVALVGADGFAELNLRRPDAHRVQIVGEQSVNGIDFGVTLLGNNTAPGYATAPTLSVVEDQSLLVLAPGLLADGNDDEGDGFIALPGASPSVGTVSIRPDGGLTFTPPADFDGTAEISVILHDGGTFTETVVEIDVQGTPDAPTGVVPTINPVPENILVGEAIGLIDIIDVDAVNEFEIEIDDGRFEVINGQIIFIGGGAPLNFEDLEDPNQGIPLIFTVYDPDADTTIEHSASITLTDADDPITGILPKTASVFENAFGDSIAQLQVIDEDFDDFYDFSVNNSDFVVEFEELRLADGVALDFEAGETVTVDVTATHADDSYTETITITVLDLGEQPSELALANASVVEFTPEAVVGELTLGSNPAANGHDLVVNDSRFVVEGSTLRLADDTWVVLAEQDEIEIEVTATVQASGNFTPVTETFVIQVLENDTPFHNDEIPEDVNGDDNVSAVDALTIVNFLNTFGPGPVGHGDPGFGYDVNADSTVTALDALLVINELNRGGGGGTVGNEPNGEETETKRSTSDDLTNAPAPSLAQSQDSDSDELHTNDVAVTEMATENTAQQSQKAVAESAAIDTSIASVKIASAETHQSRTDSVFGEDSIELLSDDC